MNQVESLEFTSFSFAVTKEVIAAFSNVLESQTLYYFFSFCNQDNHRLDWGTFITLAASAVAIISALATVAILATFAKLH